MSGRFSRVTLAAVWLGDPLDWHSLKLARNERLFATRHTSYLLYYYHQLPFLLHCVSRQSRAHTTSHQSSAGRRRPHGIASDIP